MKTYKLKLDLEFEVDAPDSVTEDSEILDILSEQIALNNETVENIFWESIEVEEAK